MGEEKLIEEINKKKLFVLKLISNNEMEVFKLNGDKLKIRYSNPIYLKLINDMLDKQIFKPTVNNLKVSPNANILCNLKFDIIEAFLPSDWVYMCDVSTRYIHGNNPYQAVIRLVSIGDNHYEITNIDRNRKVWN